MRIYLELTKPRILVMVLVTTALGFLLGSANHISFTLLLLTLLGMDRQNAFPPRPRLVPQGLLALHGTGSPTGQGGLMRSYCLAVRESLNHLLAWVWASTNQSHLSMPRETSVKMSVVSASLSPCVSSMVTRASRPNVDSARGSGDH